MFFFSFWWGGVLVLMLEGTTRRFPKIRGTLLGVPIIRTIVFWGLYWGPLILGNYHTSWKGSPSKHYFQRCSQVTPPKLSSPLANMRALQSRSQH